MANKSKELIELKFSLFNLRKYSKKKKGYINELRRLIITVSLFLLMQLLFIGIDVTSLEPNLNKMGSFTNKLKEKDFFNKWFILYENPIFKLITIIGDRESVV